MEIQKPRFTNRNPVICVLGSMCPPGLFLNAIKCGPGFISILNYMLLFFRKFVWHPASIIYFGEIINMGFESQCAARITRHRVFFVLGCSNWPSTREIPKTAQASQGHPKGGHENAKKTPEDPKRCPKTAGGLPKSSQNAITTEKKRKAKLRWFF